MTTFFHCRKLPDVAHKPELQVSHVLGKSGDYVSVALELGFDTLFIDAGLGEAEQLASAFRQASDALVSRLAKDSGIDTAWTPEVAERL